MKYIVLGLLLSLMVTGKPTGATAEPMTYDSVVTLDHGDPGVLATEVTIHLQQRPGVTVLTVLIRQVDEPCGPGSACGPQELFDGSQSQRIPAADATIDRQLAWESLHTRIPVLDSISKTSQDITLDVQWTATGAIAPLPDGAGQMYERDAAAWGIVTSRSLGTVPLQSTDPGTLSWHTDG